VTAQSRLDAGSTFLARLPLKAADSSATDPPGAVAPGAVAPGASAAGRGAVGASDVAADSAPIGAHVLLVEDEPVNAAVAQGYLEELGCTSVWADGGAKAIALSATERFDLIMMDLNMPTMDGYATTRLIREGEGGRTRLPIIALTAHDAKNHRAACLAAGMDDLLSKPYTLDQCSQLLRRWIKRSPRRAGDLARPADPARSAVQSSPVTLASRAAARTMAASDAAAPPLAAVTQIDGQTVTGLKNLRSLGNSDLYSKLVAMFQPASAKAIAELGAALAANDFEDAAGVCHKFASSAANVGALIFAGHIRDLERLCRDRDNVRAARLFETIRAALPALIEELTRLQMRESA
jgi:CheY-like chemotaxis protein